MKTKEKSREIIFSAHQYMWGLTQDIHLRYILYAALVLLGQAINVTLSFTIGQCIDIVNNVSSKYALSTALWIIAALSATRCVISVSEARYHIKHLVYDIETLVQKYATSKLSLFSPGQTTRENTGLKMDTLQKGISAVAELMTLLFKDIIPTTTRVLISVIFLAYIHWSIAISVALLIISFTIASTLINNAFVDEVRRVRKLESEIDTRFWEIVKHLKLVITMAMQEITFSRYFAEQDKVYREGRKVWVRYNMMAGYLRNLPFEHLTLAPLFLLVFTLVQKKSITLGDVAVIIALITNAYTAINGIGTMQRQIVRHSVNVNRLKDMIEQPPECTDIQDAVELIRLRGKIEFRNVTFAYEGNDLPALHDVSFTIRPGEQIAFVGHSGSGKSTIVSLLLRNYVPQSGTIYVDDLPLNEIAINSLRRSIGVVAQETAIWDTTIRDNVTFGAPGISEDRLGEVLESARITDFYDRLGETGIDTKVGEHGVQLSGGERQRIAIARALARDPQLLIFDEATSALDYRIEAEVFLAMQDALTDRTGIIIAHRLGTVRQAHRIIVLDHGRIVGEGSFEDLSRNCEQFKSLITSEVR